mmetsp:Transcript_35038/g.56074  ORF Transcript_35038/g.56074 Transcript_35038/m.56074 type:complete len:657 (+) Transcript_35038:350-2320(+)
MTRIIPGTIFLLIIVLAGLSVCSGDRLAIIPIILAAVPVRGGVFKDVEGRCGYPPEGSECSSRLNTKVSYYIPVARVYTNGTREEITSQGLLDLEQQHYNSIRSVQQALTPECVEASFGDICENLYRECVELEVDGQNGKQEKLPFPLVHCLNMCDEAWDVCGPTYELAHSAGIDTLPWCGQYEKWKKWPTEYQSRLLVLDDIVPKELLGHTFYSLDHKYSLTIRGREYSFLCQDRGVVSSGTGIVETCSEAHQKAVCGEGMYTPSKNDTCSCSLICPLSLFENYEIFAHLERVLAMTALPGLGLLVCLEVNSRARLVNPYILICSIAGFLYCLVTIIYVTPGITGCDHDSASFTAVKPQFWQDDPVKCSIMRVTPHLLQVLVNALFCFMVETHQQFVCAVNFGSKFDRRTWLVPFTLLIVVYPFICLVFTLIMGSNQSETVYDGYFMWNSVRHLHKCGPAYHSLPLEIFFVQLPIFIGFSACVAQCIKLRTLCIQVSTRVSSKSESVRPGRGAYVNQTARLASQMLVINILFMIMLSLQIISVVYLSSILEEFQDFASDHSTCQLIPYEPKCSDLPEKWSGASAAKVMLFVHTISMSGIPLLFGGLFSYAVFIKNKHKIAASMVTLNKITSRPQPTSTGNSHYSASVVPSNLPSN